MKILAIVLTALIGLYSYSTSLAQHSDQTKPNIIVIFTDDQGYGDLSSYGAPNIRTPHIDKMAFEGQKWTSFYAAASVCTPSRAGLLTGRYPLRSGMASDVHRVLFPDSKGGLPENEITVAEQVKKAGYQTAMIGKWHLGHHEQYLPTNQGFDYYYGIPYYNDMDPVEGKSPYWEYADEHIPYEYYNVPLMRNTEIIELSAFEYRTPEGFNSCYEHFLNFYDAIRNGTKLLKDGTFGLRSAAPALACNISHERA